MTSTISLTDKKMIISAQNCFAPLADNEVEELASLLTEKHFSPGQMIVAEGEPVDSVYFIVSGIAEVRHVIIKNSVTQTTLLTTLSSGEAIGLNETGFYSLSGLRTATVVAISEMVLLRLSVAGFHGFALSHSHVNEIMRKNAESMLDAKP
jgi:CRP-like cAMP-binding protein